MPWKAAQALTIHTHCGSRRAWGVQGAMRKLQYIKDSLAERSKAVAQGAIP